MVVAAQPLATAAGVEMLERGGNAADAAVAAAFAVSVVEPSMNSIGGRTQILVRTAEGTFHGIDATTQAPDTYDPDTAPQAGYGYPTVGLPGTVAGLSRLLDEHGTLPLATVMEPAIRYASEGFALLAGEAARLGITLCLEPLVASLTNFMNDTREGIAVARRMNHPAVKLVLDVKQISQETQSFQAAVDLALPWLAHVHVNDANTHAPGEGDTDFAPIIRKLKSVGYEGLLSIEAFAFTDDPAVVLPRSRAYLEEILAAA